MYEGIWQRTLPDGGVEYKVILDGRWAVKQPSEAADSEPSVYYGGSYVVPGDVFVETVDFVEAGDTNLIGKSFVYHVSVEEDMLLQNGMGADVESLEWSRVEVVAETSTVAPKAFEMGAIAIINVGDGAAASCGSGFVVEMDGKKYLVTNQHVLDSMSSIKIKTLENVLIRPASFEISRKQDLVRLEITNDIPALVIQQELPSIGDAVSVYGNSAGGGVATEIHGKVLGVGPDLVEVDAEFVPGNSGCPMLNSEGEVLGVASYATLYQDPENEMSKNTRFQEVRRYGIRLNNDDWFAVSPRVYQKQVQELSDQEQAVFMYAITYLSFKYYMGEPSKYTYESIRQGNSYVSRRVDRDKETYEQEYAYWQEFVERFNSVKPEEELYSSEVLYRRCETHYEKAARAFNPRSKGLDWKQRRQLREDLQKDSAARLKYALRELKKFRGLSKHLQDQGDQLVNICEYILELDEQ